MPPASNVLIVLVVTICMTLAVVLMTLGAVLSRLRKLSRPLAETARLVDDLSQRQRALESLLESIEPAMKSAAEGAGGPARSPVPTRRADRAEPNAAAGATLITVPNLAASASNMTSAMAELGRRFGAIWAMADQGASAEEIAREAGYPIGQVELILGLRRQSSGTVAGPSKGGRA